MTDDDDIITSLTTAAADEAEQLARAYLTEHEPDLHAIRERANQIDRESLGETDSDPRPGTSFNLGDLATPLSTSKSLSPRRGCPPETSGTSSSPLL